MARKPAADKGDSGAGEKAKPRKKASPPGAWLPPPLPWILRAGRAARRVDSPSRIFCARSTEAFLLAPSLRDADVVAVEEDPHLVKAARTAAGRRRLRHLRIEEAFLDQPALGELIGGNFDLVVAHDVLHRVKDADAAFANLAAACAADGTIYLSVRSLAHPSSRLDSALAAFGLERGDLNGENEEAENVARLLAGLGGFSPSAAIWQSDGPAPAPLAVWLDRARAAGLHLCATTLPAKVLPASLNAGGSKLLSSFSLAKLAALLDAYLQPDSVELVFTRQPAPVVPWENPEALSCWRPVSRFLPLDKLPEMQEPWNGLAGIEVEITNVLAPQNFSLSHYLVELIRRSDGEKTLASVMSEIPHETEVTELVGALHFLHHCFILELQAPQD